MEPLRPIHYNIGLEPDLDRFEFEGTLSLDLEAAQPVAEVALNVLELNIKTCHLADATAPAPCAFDIDPKKELLHIQLPRACSGSFTLQIAYRGKINNRLAGFYRSGYRKGAEQKYIAVTQFQESDARRAFPCMDHPAHKATFDISLDIDPELTAISNGSILEQKPLPNGKTRVRFERTPRMSTYLLFFGVGEFEIIRDQTDTRVRVAAMPATIAHGRFGLEFGRKALTFSEDYYGLEYPLSKMDLIAVPDFAYGAMENWGAITFRENLLLHYPQTTSRAGEMRICEVIAHEIAHQWFGNLVTPSDWKYLWLNESFATYFGFGVVDHYYPQWDVWEQFLQTETDTALARDALHETFAIEIPGGEHVVINASTAPLIYNKGGSVLRQINGFIGDGHFKAGLRRYLKQHAYGCATSHDLWDSFEAVSQQPVSRMMRSWIEQPGYPLLEVQRREDCLYLEQKRFTYLPEALPASAGSADRSDQLWDIPLKVAALKADGSVEHTAMVMDQRTANLPLDTNTLACKVNAGQTGFYRVRYDDQTLSLLGRQVRAQKLPATDRWGLQNDLFALVQSGRATFDDWFAFLDYYDAESAYLPLTSIAGNLMEAYLILDETRRRQIAARAVPWFEKVLGEIGLEPASDEKQTQAMLREQFLWAAALWGSAAVRDRGDTQFKRLVDGHKLHADLMKSTLRIAALTGDEKTFVWMDERFRTAPSEHERTHILLALGCFANSRLLQKSLDYVLSTVPARNKFIPIGSMASNPVAVPLLWDWYQTRLKEIETFHPLHYERVVGAIVPRAGLTAETAVVDFFREYRQRTDRAADVIKLSLEKLAINRRMRRLNPGQ